MAVVDNYYQSPEYKHDWYIKNRARILEMRKDTYRNDSAPIKVKTAKWAKDNPIKVRGYKTRWRLNNPEKQKAAVALCEQKNPNLKLARLFRRRVYLELKKHKTSNYYSSTFSLIGCSIEQLRQHLESQFIDGMSWENHGIKGWHIDHIIPCDYFDLFDPVQQSTCFHYSNLQPLWWIDNLRKGNKIMLREI